MTEGRDYPLHGYLYTIEGMHGPPTVLYDRDALHTFLRHAALLALDTGRECLIVTGDDAACVFHIKDGQVLYASGAEPAVMVRALRRGTDADTSFNPSG